MSKLSDSLDYQYPNRTGPTRIRPGMSTVLALALAVVALAAPATAVDPVAPSATCAGHPATIVSAVPGATVPGTAGDDVIVAAPLGTVLAGDGDDLVCTSGGDVEGGAGDDRVVVLGTDQDDHGRFEPGPGEDTVSLAGPVVRLLEDRVRVGAGDSYLVRHVEHYRVDHLGPVEVTGSDGPDDVRVSGCTVTVHGGGGDDRLAASAPLACAPGDRLVARLYGGGGDDHLRGTPYRDSLVGGPGEDRANGSGSRDRCRAERQDRCER